MTDAESYVELRCRSAFSFLAGASLPEDLVTEAARLQHDTISIVDRDGVYGAPRAFRAASTAGLRALIGADVAIDGRRLALLVADHRATGTALMAMRHARALCGIGVNARIIGQNGRSLERFCRAEALWQKHSLSLDRAGKPWAVARDVAELRQLIRRLQPAAIIAYGTNEQIIAGFAGAGQRAAGTRGVLRSRAGYPLPGALILSDANNGATCACRCG